MGLIAPPLLGFLEIGCQKCHPENKLSTNLLGYAQVVDKSLYCG